MNQQNKAGLAMTYMWDRYTHLAIKSPYLVMLGFASILLSIASFFTTFDGMLDFMPIWVFSAFITFAIQALLLVTSWKLGFMFAGKDRIEFLVIGVFVVCFVTSVFFSFSSLFNFIFDPALQEDTTRTRVHNAVQDTITELEFKSKDRRQKLVEDLTETNAYATWRDNVMEVARVASSAKERLRDIFSARYQAKIDELALAEEEAANMAAMKGNSGAIIADAEREIASLNPKRVPLEREIDRLESNLREAKVLVNQKKVEMDEEEFGGDPTQDRRKGRGPVWLSLRDEHTVLIKKQKGIELTLNQFKSDLKAIEDEIQANRDKIATASGSQSSSDTRIASAEAKAKALREEVDAMGAGGEFNPAESATKLRSLIDDFSKNYALSSFDRAANLCNSLLEEMKKISDLSRDVENLSCDRGAMSAKMNPINDAALSLAALTDACISSGKAVSDMTPEDALTHARNCMNLSKLPSDNYIMKESGIEILGIGNLRAEIDRIDREETGKASPFTKTSNALFAGEKLAIFSLVIALIIDLLVLFSGLIGARSVRSKIDDFIKNPKTMSSDDILDNAMNLDLTIYPEDDHGTRNLKIILKYAKSFSYALDDISYTDILALSDIPDPVQRENLRPTLVAFVGQDLLAADAKDENFYYFKQGALNYLRHRLGNEQEMKKILGNAVTDYSNHRSHQPTGKRRNYQQPRPRGGFATSASRAQERPKSASGKPENPMPQQARRADDSTQEPKPNDASQPQEHRKPQPKPQPAPTPPPPADPSSAPYESHRDSPAEKTSAEHESVQEDSNEESNSAFEDDFWAAYEGSAKNE